MLKYYYSVGYTSAPPACPAPAAACPDSKPILKTSQKGLKWGENPTIFTFGRLAGISFANPARAERQQP